MMQKISPPFFFGFLRPYVQMEEPTPRMKEPAQNTEEDSIVEWKNPLKLWKKIPSWNGRTRFKNEITAALRQQEIPV